MVYCVQVVKVNKGGEWMCVSTCRIIVHQCCTSADLFRCVKLYDCLITETEYLNTV